MLEAIKEWVYQVLISLDQLVNTLLGGAADETMSSRCFRLNHIKTYSILEKIVNVIFYPFQGPDHCKHAYEKEVLGRQLPYRFYSLALEMNLRFDNEKLGNKIEIPDDNTNRRTENNT